MESKKKFTITIAVLAIALLISVSAMIIVIVSANQNANSAVNVKYTAQEVYVRLSANAYVGATTTAFTDSGNVNGNTSIDLSPTDTNGSLSQPNSGSESINLDKTNDTVVFEYSFLNMTDNIDVKIDLTSIPAIRENLKLSYVYSDTKITDVSILEGETVYTPQLLPAYTGEETAKYVYIIAEIDNLLYNSSLEGNFEWALSKPDESEVNVVTFNVGNIDYVERETSNLATTNTNSTYSLRTLVSTVSADDLTLYPAVVNKAFVGWTDVQGSSNVISTIQLANNDNMHNIIGATTARTLYPVYKDSTVPDNNLEYYQDYGCYVVEGDIETTVTDFVYPDVYNKGTDGVAKVKYIWSMDVFDGVLNSNKTIESVYHGRYITQIGEWTYSGCSNLSNVYFNENCTHIFEGAFSGCSSLNNVIIPSSVECIYDDAFQACTSLNNIIIKNGIKEIEQGAFSGCTGLTSIIIPNSITTIELRVFSGCTNLTSIIFEDVDIWQKASNATFTSDLSTVDVSNPTQNAIWLTSTSGYYDYYWRKI